ncbi:MAG TPA: hypothetical protein VNV44_13390 [Solirubrobacteraceae bacterium]|nr:hypothetical protein [Solirubrobacteraceae bacterium]
MRRRSWLIGGLAIALLVAAALAWLWANGQEASTDAQVAQPGLQLAPLSSLGSLREPGPAGPLGPEEVPIPAAPPAATTAGKAQGAPVDGIECSTSEQTLFHIHAHLTIFIDGATRRVPAGIGIPDAQAENTPRGPFVGSGRCFYWLHTHAADGIIHVESPVERVYTLGEFFDIWGQPLGRQRVGPVTGRVTAIYNGGRVEADPRQIPLTAHAQIQLEVGRPLVGPDTIRFPEGL